MSKEIVASNPGPDEELLDYEDGDVDKERIEQLERLIREAGEREEQLKKENKTLTADLAAVTRIKDRAQKSLKRAQDDRDEAKDDLDHAVRKAKRESENEINELKHKLELKEAENKGLQNTNNALVSGTVTTVLPLLAQGGFGAGVPAAAAPPPPPAGYYGPQAPAGYYGQPGASTSAAAAERQPPRCYKCGIVGHLKKYCPEWEKEQNKGRKERRD